LKARNIDGLSTAVLNLCKLIAIFRCVPKQFNNPQARNRRGGRQALGAVGHDVR
jgi:hypothetical protein